MEDNRRHRIPTVSENNRRIRPKLLLSLMGAVLFAVLWGAAAPAQSLPHLTPEQEAIARRLDGMFMAPCCFANTLAEHHSPLAGELRQEIRTMLASGATETQIADAFVAKYGERILAAPTAQGFNLLAWILPGIVIAAGSVVIAVVMRRRRPQAPSAGVPPEVSDQVKARFEAELARFRK